MIPVFDGHNDTLIAADHGDIVTGRVGGHLDLPRMRQGGMRGGIFAVFTPTTDDRDLVPDAVPRDDDVIEWAYDPEVPRERAAAWTTKAAGRLFALERAGELTIARGTADLDAAFAAPPDGPGDGTPPVAVLHFEGAEAIDPELDALETWYAAGLRSVGLVWSRPNRFAHGVPFVFPSSPDLGPGLTPGGHALTRRCAELGILVDLSHLNEAGFWDVAALDAGPLVASHAGAHALAPCSRNLTDRQLDAVGASGGLVGIVYACGFLRADFGEDPETTPLSLIVDHARYVADRIGVDHVALGSDFDGAPVPRELADVAGLPRLLDALATDGGFTADEVEAIAWRNWRRVLDVWWR